MAWWYGAALLAANLALLLPDGAPLRTAGGLLLIGLLPGLGWAALLLPAAPRLLRWVTAAALSYTLTSLVALGLHYLPGPIERWQLVLVLDAVALAPLVKAGLAGRPGRLLPALPSISRPAWPPADSLVLALILLISLFLRAGNLGYSEFQGDEALVMISAAETLSGHEDALWLRSKGPGEVLLPLALWRLTGIIDEAAARLPFTGAALLAVATVYLIGQRLGGPRAGWLAAGFFAFNGFTVAFGRIVQYQALVIWFSALAVLLALEAAATRQRRYPVLAGLALGAGLLAHYDAILALPAIGWLLLGAGLATCPLCFPAPGGDPEGGVGRCRRGPEPHSPGRRLLGGLVNLGLFLLPLLLVALPFYLPYALDPQAGRTGDYVGGRIGAELRNNLPDFFHFTTFYSSAYYLLVTGLLVLGLLAWYAGRGGGDRRECRGGRRAVAALLLLGVGAVILRPDLLLIGRLNLAGLPFALLLLAAGLAWLPRLEAGLARQASLLWLAVPFLGYNFVVALGLTHIYTTVPAWAVLAGLAWNHLSARLAFLSPALLAILLALSTVFLGNAFLRHDVEYWQDYPAGNLPLYWDPYAEPPPAGFFGFAHRAGWKAVGQKIAAGELRGDYGSNEEPDVTTWYTRGAPRACDDRPEFYFLAADLIDPVAVPDDLIAAGYAPVGRVTLPNQKGLQIVQQQPARLALGELAEAALARDFDRTATPAAFARAGRGSIPAGADFGRLVRLIGYDLDRGRAYPGGRLPVTLYWQALAPIPASYQVFTHLESAAGPAAQADGVPVCWSYPTDRWRPGQIIADQHAIPLPADLTPGDYPLEVGLYLPDTGQRLDVLDTAGNPAGTSVTLATLTIQRQQDK